MFGFVLHALLCLSAPAGDASPAAGPSTAAAVDLRPVAWRDEPRTRAVARPIETLAASDPELREPFAAPTPAPKRATTKPVGALREPFATARRQAPGPAPAPVPTRAPTPSDTALREPF